MSRQLKRLWSALERVPDLSGVQGEWRSLLGGEHAIVARFLLPVDTHEGKFVILAEPIAAGKIGRAYAAGVCPVQIIVLDEDAEAYQFADIFDAYAVGLFADPNGSASILWKEEGTGLKWAIVRFGNRQRMDWEDDDNCMNHNPYTQTATATCEIIVPRDTLMTVTWTGMGETQDPNYELMSLFVNGLLVGSAHAPGGQLGCAGGMAPVVSNPPPPQQVLLATGPHILFIDATTNDPLYHFGAWYRFDLTFEEVPPAP